MKSKLQFGFWLAVIAAWLVHISCRAAEYEVDGRINQTIAQFKGPDLHTSASFTIYVRDCGWLISMLETNDDGHVANREIGSTNGTEIYSCSWPPGGASADGIYARVESNTVPVGWLDMEVSGHLWLMFASQCYWPKQNSDQLLPVYDWHACAGAHGQNLRVSGDWSLLNGPGSLPREVIYYNGSNQTNAIYTVTGTNRAGETLIPARFVFEQQRNGKREKYIEAQVTAVRSGCSRARLIPSPGSEAIIVDSRLEIWQPDHLPSYRNPVFGEWPTLDEAKELAGISATAKPPAQNQSAGAWALQPVDSPKENAGPPVLSVEIRCTVDELKAGDEIPIEFRITNRGTNNYSYADRNYDRSGRMYEYKLMAKNEAGQTLPDPRAAAEPIWITGGIYQNGTLKPGESFSQIIPLNRWALVKDSGRYTVTGSYPAGSMFSSNIVIEAPPIQIRVSPRTPEEMAKYIDGLAARVNAHLSGIANDKWSRAPNPELNEAVMKLMYTCNPRIVPSLLKSLCDSNSGGGFWESEALRFYVPHTEEVRKAIFDMAHERGLGANGVIESLLQDYHCTTAEVKPLIERALASTNSEEWAVGAQLAKPFGDDAFTERLIAIAKTPRNPARMAAIDALAFNRTDAGVKALKELINDPHKDIWTPLAYAIENAYDSRRGAMGRPLRPDDFTVADLKPLITRLLSDSAGANTGVSIIERFGGDDFTAQLIAIANEPENFARDSAIYALALNRTDEGLRTLRALLKDGDPKIRASTEAAIRYAYTDRGNSRGRPLKPEDFDESYRRPEKPSR